MNKLNPSYYFKQAMKATNPKDWFKAHEGLMYLYGRHATYQWQEFLKLFKNKNEN